MITTFGEDHWVPQRGFNPVTGFKTMESKINHHYAAPLFLDNVKNRTKQNFTIINENPRWEESMIPVMRPASFYENSEAINSGLENQEWARNFPGVSSTSKYGHQPSPMANIHGYHHEFHPSNMMQFSSYHHGPEQLTSTWRMPTDVMMNAYMHH